VARGKLQLLSGGRPEAAVNPLELLTWWEGRGGRRPLSLRVEGSRKHPEFP
jgi:hypothetical protein